MTPLEFARFHKVEIMSSSLCIISSALICSLWFGPDKLLWWKGTHFTGLLSGAYVGGFFALGFWTIYNITVPPKSAQKRNGLKERPILLSIIAVMSGVVSGCVYPILLGA